MKDLYKILGVSSSATKDEIKKRYREFAKKFHPDRFATASESEKKRAEESFREINEAYSILSDDLKRKEYDERIKNRREGFEKTNKTRKNSNSSGEGQSFQDIYESLRNGDIFKNFFNIEKDEEKDKTGERMKEQTNKMFESFFFQGRGKK